MDILGVDDDDYVPDKGRRREAERPSVTTDIVEESTRKKGPEIDDYKLVPRFHHFAKELSSDHSPVPVGDAVGERMVPRLLFSRTAVVRIDASAAKGQRSRVRCAPIPVQEAVDHITQFPRKCVTHLAANCFKLDLSVCFDCLAKSFVGRGSVVICGVWNRQRNCIALAPEELTSAMYRAESTEILTTQPAAAHIQPVWPGCGRAQSRATSCCAGCGQSWVDDR